MILIHKKELSYNYIDETNNPFFIYLLCFEIVLGTKSPPRPGELYFRDPILAVTPSG